MEEIDKKANEWIGKRARSHWNDEDVREAYIAGYSEKITLPDPDCHFFDEEKQKWVWAYSTELIKKIVK